MSSRAASGLARAACRAGLARSQWMSTSAGLDVPRRLAVFPASQLAMTGSGSSPRPCSMMSAMVTPNAVTGASCRRGPAAGLASARAASPPGCAERSSRTAAAAAGRAAVPVRAEAAARATTWTSSRYCCRAAVSAGWPLEAISAEMTASMCCWAASTSPPGGRAGAGVTAGSLVHDTMPPRGRRCGSSGRPVRSQRPGRRGCPVRVRWCRRPQSGQVSASRTWQRVQAKVHGIRQASIHRPPLTARQRGQ